MHESKYACLQDKEHGLTYYEVPVDGFTDELVEEIRNMFIARMKDFGYIGFSHDIDNEFHYRSNYVYVANEMGAIVMTSRITNRPIGKIIPFEMGIMENGNSYSLESYENVIDINTYVHVKEYYEHSMPLLAAGFGRHLDNLGVEKAFCLYDVKNFIIKKAYISIGFIPSERFPEPIYFPTFCRRSRRTENGHKRVFWRIMEWDSTTIEHHSRIAKEKYAKSF